VALTIGNTGIVPSAERQMSWTLTSSAAAMLTLMAALALGALAQAQSADPTARTRDDAGILLTSAEAHLTAGRPLEAIADAGMATTLAPTSPAAWYELGRAYDAVAQHARGTFEDGPASAPWRQLIAAATLEDKLSAQKPAAVHVVSGSSQPSVVLQSRGSVLQRPLMHA